MDRNHAVNFALAHGETIVFENIPVGSQYEVIEENPDGYTVTMQNESGTAPKDGIAVEVINTKNGTVPTSGDTNIRTLLLLAAIAAAGAAWTMFRRNRKNR